MSIFAIHHLASNCEEKTLQKIITAEDYETACRTGKIPYQEADIADSRKCIHCTFSDQTQDKINKFFKGKRIILLELNLAKLEDYGFELKIESNPDGTNKYPHLYHKTGLMVAIPIECVNYVHEW